MEEWDKPVINEIDINYTLGEAGGGDDLNGGTKSTVS